MWRSLFAALLLAGTPPAFAQPPGDAKATSASVAVVLRLTAFVDAADALCAELAPEAAPAVHRAVGRWYRANGLWGAIDLAGAVADDPKLLGLADAYRNEVAQQKAKLYRRVRERAAGWCAGFPEQLAGPKLRVTDRFSDDLARFNAFAASRLDRQPLPPGRTLEPVERPRYLDLLKIGLDPETRPIPTTFRCYRARPGRDHRWPEIEIRFDLKGRYQSSYGPGRWRVVEDGSTTWLHLEGGPLEDKTILSYDRYGQFFELETRIAGQFGSYACFQQGPREEAARVLFRLADPDPGAYLCTDLKSGRQQTLELDPARAAYRLGKQEGRFAVRGVLDDGRPDARSELVWIDGPLAKGRGRVRYHEEEGTGLRTIEMSVTEDHFFLGTGGSSSSLKVVCQASGEPLARAKYGEETAPPPPAGAGGLEGFYYTLEDRVGYWSMESSDAPVYLTFFPDGYVFVGQPAADPRDVSCDLTWPNGEPVCEVYVVSNGTIRLGSRTPAPFKKQGGALIVGGDTWKRVPPSRPLKLAGRFSHAQFTRWGTLDWGGSSYTKTVYTFTADGWFQVEVEGHVLNSVDGGFLGTGTGVSVHAQGLSRERNRGRYRIDGHVITLEFDDGRVLKKFIWVRSPDLFYLDDHGFTRDEDAGDGG